MNRLFLITSIFVLGLVIGLLVLAYFAYVIDTGPPESAEVPGIGRSVTVQWSASHVAAIDAQNTRDAFAGLAYAQASRRTWPMLLFRSAALGQLSTLLGEEGLEADRTVLRLGLADGARQAFDALSDEQMALLESFAAGINAALSDRRILRDPALILSGLYPEPWEPWHSIAVERLFAWLGAEPETDSAAVRSRPLREVLLFHDFNRSAVVASMAPLEPGIYARYVFGSSAVPALIDVRATPVFGHEIQGSCLIGTPFFFAGRTENRAWAFLPTSRYQARSLGEFATSAISHKRIRTMESAEQLVAILADSSGVVLEWDERVEPKPDASDYVVSWTGLGPVSDAASWLSIFSADPNPLDLFDGAGIAVSRDGVQFVGAGLTPSPPSENFVTVAQSPWIQFANRRLDSLATDTNGFYPRLWFLDHYSLWASETVPGLISVIDSAGSPPLREAAAYLRNWDFSFDRASIAASIFNVWAETAREIEGAWPGVSDPAPIDSDPARLRADGSEREQWNAYLEFAVARLISDFGSDMSTWRWERVNAGELRFPILGEMDPGRSRFVPTAVNGLGHPSTPAWGPPEVYARLKPHSFWEGWTLMKASGSWVSRRLVPETDATFRGSVTPGDTRQPVTISDAQRHGIQTTTLRPPE